MPEIRVDTLLGGRYRLENPIARGGMAAVWVAQDTTLSRRVAVKILDPHLGVDEALRTRFRREAIAAAGLAHPGIVATYDTGDDEGVAFIVMEYVEGPTARKLIEERGPLPVAMACDLAAQIADALEFAHQHGIVHRDVKPGNVIVRPDGRAKVTDFGIAKAAGEGDLTRTGTVVGTARYLAPEQVEGRGADSRADVYALGLVLFEMLVGRPAFQADSEIATAVARLHQDPPRLDTIRSDIPPALADAVARATARDVAARTPTARAFFDSIAAFAGHRVDTGGLPEAALVDTGTTQASRTIAMRPPTPPPVPQPMHQPAPRSSSVGPWLAAVGMIVFAIGLGLGFFVTRAVLEGDDAGGSPAPTTTRAATAELVPIASAVDFDPEAGDRENPDEVDFAFDGNPETAWTTERYNSRDVGGKGGVGIAFDLGAITPIRNVGVVATEAGWNAELYVADAPGTTLADWGAPIGGGEGLGVAARFDDLGAEGRYLLLWVTLVPESRRFGLVEITVER